jgi:hypothetical protein
LPIVQQATFSFGKSSELMRAYANKSKYHKEVVQKTRQLGEIKKNCLQDLLPINRQELGMAYLCWMLIYNLILRK